MHEISVNKWYICAWAGVELGSATVVLLLYLKGCNLLFWKMILQNTYVRSSQ